MKVKVKITTQKYGGDDRYSWAVFASNQSHPIVAGLSRSEAQYHAKRIREIYARDHESEA
jgi:hypothetical protein